MAVGSSSRYKSKARRQASSDIEEDQPTQGKNKDRADDDEDAHSRRSRTVKREKKPTASRRAKDDDSGENVAGGGENDEDNDDGRINIDDFHNQPLVKADGGKLQGLASDWDLMEKKIRQNWNVVGDVAAAMAEVAEGKEGEKGLVELELIMKDLIDIGYEMRSHQNIIDDIYQKLSQGEEIDDVSDRYDNGIAKRMKEYAKKTTRQKYVKNEQYASFKQGIHEVQHPDKAMPPITDLIPKEDGDDSDDDDDLEIGGVTQNYNCPISLTPLVNPVTSAVCGHSFSAEAIRSTFINSNASKKCPASGCNKSFTLSDCKPNKDLAKKVKGWQRRTRRAEENSDAEEVIE